MSPDKYNGSDMIDFQQQVQADTTKAYQGGIEVPQYGNDLKPKPQRQYPPSFWSGDSPYQKMVDEIFAAGMEIPNSYKYYRWYNDGDYPAGMLGAEGRALYHAYRGSAQGSERKKELYAKINEMLEKKMSDIVQATYNKWKNPGVK